MKKFILALCVFGSFNVQAAEDGQFYEEVLISTDIKTEKKSSDAQARASELLNAKPAEIKIEGEPLEFRSRRIKTAAPLQSIDTSTPYGEGPFGLSWGANYNQTIALGAEMQKVERDGQPNSFIVTKMPKPIVDFKDVTISYGNDNKLWRIVAYGVPEDDNASATKGLHLYRKYYKLLNMKYGHAKEVFVPKITTIERKYTDNYGRPQVEVSTREESIGGANFLQELQNKETSLHATFQDSDVGAALTINVNNEGQTYIIVDYTNLRIFKEREDVTLDAL